MHPLHLTDTEQVTVVSRSADVLAVDVRYAPGGSPPPKHLHPEQDERFVLRAGRLRVRLGGKERELSAGDELAIPRGTPHTMWNAGSEPVLARWETRPAGRTLDWFEALDALHRSSGGRADLLGLATLLRAYPDVFRLAGPRPLVGAFVGVLAAVGRLRRRGVPAAGEAARA